MEIAVALVAAVVAAATAWWGQPGRRALGIHRYVQLLNDLPSASEHRDRLALEIDKMVKSDLDDRVTNEVLRMVWTSFGFVAFALVATSLARSAGGLWIVLAAVAWSLMVLTAAALGFGVVRLIGAERKRKTDDQARVGSGGKRKDHGSTQRT